jgi:hypothetical protein
MKNSRKITVHNLAIGTIIPAIKNPWQKKAGSSPSEGGPAAGWKGLGCGGYSIQQISQGEN